MKDPKSLLNAFEDTFDFEKQEDLLGDISFLRNDHLVLRYWDYFPDTSSLTTLELLTDSYALLLNGKSKELKLGSEFYVDLKSEIDALNECFEFINFIIKVDNQNLVTKIMITIRWT